MPDALAWCAYKADAIYGTTSDASLRVETMMSDIEKKMPENHMEHGPSWSGCACWPFLDCGAHVVDDALIERAVNAAREYKASQIKRDPNDHQAKHDWENDSVMQFLRSHKGFTVWGYSD